MSFVDPTVGSLCSRAHDLFRTSHLDRHYFLCRVTAMRSSAGFICAEKCHLSQAAKAPSEEERRAATEKNNKHVLVQHLTVDLRGLGMDC